MGGFDLSFSSLRANFHSLPGWNSAKKCVFRLFIPLLFSLYVIAPTAVAQSGNDICPRPSIGGFVPEPADLRSQNGVLKVELTFTNFLDGRGQTH
jgi:hypothetical protein